MPKSSKVISAVACSIFSRVNMFSLSLFYIIENFIFLGFGLVIKQQLVDYV